ncbi:hypothetical protein LY632_08080 [Erythrobacter sp. SDW2]|uniref:hypothetical protein n=1 Tax=Erythrobacter sp. SDW2 TaxID=2907154 RepID=UPI001F15D1A4|nr:hypothetical protein [Erythrobacter sp. SDW2]UIP05671.1 hypothetical protein LY632_08080 [Erythrobacter sp. SDW2]
MKNVLVTPLLVGLVAVAACSKPAPAPAPEPAAEETAAAPAVANGSGPGTYEVTGEDGSVGTSIINADGTYSDLDADGKVVAEGTWAVKDGKTCFTPKAEGAEEECYTESAPAADGSFTATSDKGGSVTVKPKATAAEEAPVAPAQEPAE